MATGASTPRRRDPGPGAPRLLRPYENCRSPRGPPAHETPGRTSSEPSRSPPSNPKESYLGGDGPKTIPHLTLGRREGRGSHDGSEGPGQVTVSPTGRS